MKKFASFSGIITMINNFQVSSTDEEKGCYNLISLQNERGDLANFVVEPNTYFVDHITVMIGDWVTGFFDANAPVPLASPLIFPPQYRAIVMSKNSRYQNVKVDYFNNEFISSDNTLKLNIAPCTQILLKNDQFFTASPAERNLIVTYGPTTRSIPAQTVPYKIIVMC